MNDNNEINEVSVPVQDSETPASRVVKSFTVWCWAALVSFICGAVTLYKGIHRLMVYDSGEHYPYEAVNAYVGGDAYNFIINGTHATAFFVLTTMFILAGVGFIIIHYLSKISKKNL